MSVSWNVHERRDHISIHLSRLCVLPPPPPFMFRVLSALTHGAKLTSASPTGSVNGRLEAILFPGFSPDVHGSISFRFPVAQEKVSGRQTAWMSKTRSRHTWGVPRLASSQFEWEAVSFRSRQTSSNETTLRPRVES